MGKSPWVRWGVLALLMVLPPLLLAEIYVRTFYPQNLASSAFEYDSHSGYRLHRNLNGTQVYAGRRTALKTNALGMRQSEEITEKAPNEKRVLFLGDSFTQGVGVEFEETFVALIEKRMREKFRHHSVRAMNAGTGGYGTQNMLRYFRFSGVELKPDVVILVIGPNDVEDNSTGQFYRMSSKGLEELNEVAPPLIDSPLKKAVRFIPLYDFFTTHSHLFGLLRYQVALAAMDAQKRSVEPVSSRQVASVPTPVPDKEKFELTKALILAIRDECKKHAIPLVVTHVGTAISLSQTRAFIEEGQTWFKENQIDFVDVSADFPKSYSHLVIPGDGHFNPDGHKLFADLVWKGFEKWLSRGSDW